MDPLRGTTFPWYQGVMNVCVLSNGHNEVSGLVYGAAAATRLCATIDRTLFSKKESVDWRVSAYWDGVQYSFWRHGRGRKRCYENWVQSNQLWPGGFSFRENGLQQDHQHDRATNPLFELLLTDWHCCKMRTPIFLQRVRVWESNIRPSFFAAPAAW